MTTGKAGAGVDQAPQARFLWPAGDAAEETMQVHIVWNPRRRSRSAFFFAPDGRLHVEAPPSLGVAAVRRVLRDHASWIRRQRDAATRNGACWFPSEYADGAPLLLRGNVLTLRLVAGADVHVREDELVSPSVDSKRHVWAWYSSQAKALLGSTLHDAVAALPWLNEVPRWRHRFMKSRWGSCSSSGRISLNTHLVKLPDALVEYVVMHELCHLRHLHHGPAFQRLMDASLPDWKLRQGELRRHGGLLLEPPPDAGAE